MQGKNVGSYIAQIDTLDAGSIVPCVKWMVRESGQGWSGFGVVDAAPDGSISYRESLNRAIDYGIRPEAPMALGLWARPPSTPFKTEHEADELADGEEPRLVSIRTWPSVITEVGSPTRIGDRRSGVTITFCDPLRYLLDSQVWCSYRNISPGELLGAGLSIAAGGDGTPSLTPAIAAMPGMKITESLRESIQDIPFAVATGEPLGVWLNNIFGMLGIRTELIGRESGNIDIELHDSPPKGKAVSMSLLPGKPSAVNAAIRRIRKSGSRPVRDVLFDSISFGDILRVGELTPPIGSLLNLLEGFDSKDADYLAEFPDQRNDLNLSTLEIVTEQPGLLPGRLVTFDNRSVSGAFTWQVVSTSHGQGNGRYRNSVELLKTGLSLRPRMSPRSGPVTVTGFVDDGKSDLGEIVQRDSLGRIPVRIGTAPKDTPETESDSSGMGPDMEEPDTELAVVTQVPKPVQIWLSISEPMAGASHGFIPSHRQGDICRIHVYHPLKASIGGFYYGFDNRIAKNVLDASAAIMAKNPEGQWSGMVFRPGDHAEEQDKEIVSSWNENSDE